MSARRQHRGMPEEPATPQFNDSFFGSPDLRIIALCEVAEVPNITKSANIWVVPDEDAVATRFLFVYRGEALQARDAAGENTLAPAFDREVRARVDALNEVREAARDARAPERPEEPPTPPELPPAKAQRTEGPPGAPPKWLGKTGVPRIMSEFQSLRKWSTSPRVFDVELVGDEATTWRFSVADFDGDCPAGRDLNGDLAQLRVPIRMEISFPERLPDAAVLPALRVAALLLVHGPRDRRRGHLHRGADDQRLARVVEPKFKCGSDLAHGLRELPRHDVAADSHGDGAGRAVGAAARRPPAPLLPRPAPGVYCARGAVGLRPHAAAPRGERVVIHPRPPSPCLPTTARRRRRIALLLDVRGRPRPDEKPVLSGHARRSLSPRLVVGVVDGLNLLSGWVRHGWREPPPPLNRASRCSPDSLPLLCVSQCSHAAADPGGERSIHRRRLDWSDRPRVDDADEAALRRPDHGRRDRRRDSHLRGLPSLPVRHN